MEWLQCLIYGFVSGFTEFAPVSARAHEALLLYLFGADQQPLQQLLIHTGILAALLLACRRQIARIRLERRLVRVPPKRRKRQPDTRYLMDLKLMKMAAIPLLLAFVFYPETSRLGANLGFTAALLILNGFILFIPQHLPSGNKDARSLSRLDGILIGLCSALSVLPGISRIGAAVSSAMARGAERQYAVQFSLMVSIPVILLFLLFDVLAITAAGITGVTFVLVVQYFLSAVMGYLGASCAIMMIRFLAVKAGFSGFAYYSWGVALFSFILFLMT